MLKKELFRFPDKSAEQSIIKAQGLKIAVLGACRGAGVSFVSALIIFDKMKGLSLPEGLHTMVELGSPYFYNALGMDKRFEGRTFYSYTNDRIYQLNMEMGINWFIKRPEDGDFSENLFYKALSLCPGSLTVYDCSELFFSESLISFLSKMDIIYLVVDPLPTKLLSSINNIEKIRNAFPETRLILNKFNKGIHKGELNKFLGTSDYVTIDAIDYYQFCKAEYNCVPLIPH